MESSLLLAVSSVLADSLRCNCYLRSFRLSGRNKTAPPPSREDCLRVFASMMETNFSLESFHFLWIDLLADDVNTSVRTIWMHLKLNRDGLQRKLLTSQEKTVWIVAINKFNCVWKYELDCVFNLLSNSPWLCMCWWIRSYLERKRMNDQSKKTWEFQFVASLLNRQSSHSRHRIWIRQRAGWSGVKGSIPLSRSCSFLFMTLIDKIHSYQYTTHYCTSTLEYRPYALSYHALWRLST